MTQLFYEHETALRAGLALLDNAALWRSATRRIDLVGDTGERAWLFQVAGDSPAPGHPTVEARAQGERVEIKAGDAVSQWRVVGRREAPALLQAVPLLERRGGRPPATTVLRARGAEAFQEAARECLMLGNDRLAYLALAPGDYLLRVEGLSEFLVRKWEGEPTLLRYHLLAAEPRFVLPWGREYPVADKLRFAPGGDDDYWLIDADERWRRVRGPFASIYERIEVDPARLGLTALTPAPPPRVRVDLTLTPGAGSERGGEGRERPQLWWIEARERAVLEMLLREASEETLNQLQLACVAEGDAPAYVVVQRATAAPGPPPLHGGRAYVARLPEEHLYLPHGQRLTPVLARRSLIEAFGLSEQHLTLVDAAPDGLRVRRVPRSALGAITSVVDYFAGDEPEAVAALQARFRFDLDVEPPDDEPATAPSLWERIVDRLTGR